MPVELPGVAVQRYFFGREPPADDFGAGKAFCGRFAPAKVPLYGHSEKLHGHFRVSSWRHPIIHQILRLAFHPCEKDISYVTSVVDALESVDDALESADDALESAD